MIGVGTSSLDINIILLFKLHDLVGVQSFGQAVVGILACGLAAFEESDQHYSDNDSCYQEVVEELIANLLIFRLRYKSQIVRDRSVRQNLLDEAVRLSVDMCYPHGLLNDGVRVFRCELQITCVHLMIRTLILIKSYQLQLPPVI